MAVKARAQGAPGGFGADPFQPYTRQYSPYSRPMGPAGPAGGMGGLPMYRQGFVGANQFDNYLQGLSGPGRNTSDRAGIGMPYYRSSVNPNWGPSRNRVYQPNAASTPVFEETQRKAAQQYFAYFTERDPRKRAVLLRDYRQARRQADRALTSGAISTPIRTRVGTAIRTRDEAETVPTLRARGEATRRGASYPAPPVPPRRRSLRRSQSARHPSPSDTLRRAREIDDRETGASRTPSSLTTPD